MSDVHYETLQTHTRTRATLLVGFEHQIFVCTDHTTLHYIYKELKTQAIMSEIMRFINFIYRIHLYKYSLTFLFTLYF